MSHIMLHAVSVEHESYSMLTKWHPITFTCIMYYIPHSHHNFFCGRNKKKGEVGTCMHGYGFLYVTDINSLFFNTL